MCCLLTLQLCVVTLIHDYEQFLKCISKALFIFIISKKKCKNNPDRLCYVCGKVTFSNQQCTITPLVKFLYNLYFGMKARWSRQKLCSTYVLQRLFPSLKAQEWGKNELFVIWCTFGVERSQEPYYRLLFLQDQSQRWDNYFKNTVLDKPINVYKNLLVAY